MTTVGYELRREVRDALPPGVLTAAERLLVLELADVCNDRTREGWPGAELLAELTDLSPRSIQETLSRVAKKWLELRVPLGKTDKGQVYYAYAGKRTTFRFPPLQRRQGATDAGASGAMDTGPSEPKGAMDPGGRCDGSVKKVRQIRGPSPQGTPQNFNTSSLSAREVPGPPPDEQEERDEVSSTSQTEEVSIERKLIAKRGVTGNAIDWVLRWIESGFAINGPGWWITADRNDTLDTHIAAALDAMNTTEAEPEGFTPDPLAHEFQAHTDGPECRRCGMPRANARMHRLRWADDQPRSSARNLPQNFIPDTRAPGRNYAERL